MAQKVIRCRQCGEVITDRRNLLVVGHGLQPFHRQCVSIYAAQFPWYRQPGWPINRWWAFLWFNGLLLVLVGVLHMTVLPLTATQWAAFGKLLLISNAGLMAARLTSYFSLERYVPLSSRLRRSSQRF